MVKFYAAVKFKIVFFLLKMLSFHFCVLVVFLNILYVFMFFVNKLGVCEVCKSLHSDFSFLLHILHSSLQLKDKT